jgi:hypothetical protein
MSGRNLREKRFEQRLKKTHKRFGYVSLDAIVNGYFLYRKESDDFKSIKRSSLPIVNGSKGYLSLGRLEQLYKSLDKANEVRRLKGEIT